MIILRHRFCNGVPILLPTLDADVWFRFRPPASGSVLITAQSGPAGSPTIDKNLDIQAAIWEPILGWY